LMPHSIGLVQVNAKMLEFLKQQKTVL